MSRSREYGVDFLEGGYDRSVEWQGLNRSERLDKIFELYEKAQKENNNKLESSLAEASEPMDYVVQAPVPFKADRVISFIPDSYRSNDIKEDIVLEYVENFNSQYSQLYHYRPPLLLYPYNEVGVHKFICTFIKPTLLKFPELYDVKGIAAFLPHYITYEALEKPFEIPEVVCSPTTTLYWQKGNSFDISLLMVSLLIGAGYNAYCVSGYAPLNVVENDQTHRDYPYEIEPEEELQKEEQRIFKPSKYKLKTRPNLTSNFKKEDYEVKEENKEESNLPQEQVVPEKVVIEIMKQKYVHCWILVLPGARDIKNPFFIETSTGEILEIDEAEKRGYYCIESVWNHENYWCNMFSESILSDINFDLHNLHCWEHIFIHGNKTDETEEDEENNKNEKRLEMLTTEEGEYDDDVLDVPTSWVARIQITKRQYEDRYPLNQKIVLFRNAILELFSPYYREDLITKQLTVFTDEKREKILEIHCYFSNRKDLLKRRSIYRIYKSENESTHLRDRIHEWFDPGRKTTSNFEALKELIYEKGVRREFRFYSEARLDGLEKRLELFDGTKNLYQPRKVIEYFKNRIEFGDYLWYRSITYDIEKPTINIVAGEDERNMDGIYGPINHQLTTNLNEAGSTEEFIQSFDVSSHPKKKQLQELFIVKMTEKFLRDESKNANEDVARRTFYIIDNRIRLEYHYGEGKITRSVREYTKEGNVLLELIDPFVHKPKQEERIEEYYYLLHSESKCKEDIGKSTSEMMGILKTRYSEESGIQGVTTIYDVERNRPTEEEIKVMQAREKELEEQRRNKDYVDYLIKDGVHSKEEAERIYDTVMRDLKEQLMMRINIIEERLVKEKQKLSRRRTMYQKSQEGVDRNSEEYLQFCQETAFKIKILKDRAEEHNARAVKKFANLKEKLLNHPQLAPYLQHLRSKKP
ncbi:hypothetical protein ABK040_001569 [Willaertia magna]